MFEPRKAKRPDRRSEGLAAFEHPREDHLLRSSSEKTPEERMRKKAGTKSRRMPSFLNIKPEPKDPERNVEHRSGTQAENA